VRTTTMVLAALAAGDRLRHRGTATSRGPGRPGVSDDSPDADLDDGVAVVPVDQAVVEAGGEFGVGPEDIEVVVAEEVTWPDGALGCPEPDGMYTQALVEGYRIVLEVDGRRSTTTAPGASRRSSARTRSRRPRTPPADGQFMRRVGRVGREQGELVRLPAQDGVPQAVGVVGEDVPRVGVDREPRPEVDLGLELPRRPPGVAGEHAHLLEVGGREHRVAVEVDQPDPVEDRRPPVRRHPERAATEGHDGRRLDRARRRTRPAGRRRARPTTRGSPAPGSTRHG
jgi:hypothetical protein